MTVGITRLSKAFKETLGRLHALNKALHPAVLPRDSASSAFQFIFVRVDQHSGLTLLVASAKVLSLYTNVYKYKLGKYLKQLHQVRPSGAYSCLTAVSELWSSQHVLKRAPFQCALWSSTRHLRAILHCFYLPST